MKTKTINVPIYMATLTMVLIDNGWEEFDEKYNLKTELEDYEGGVIKLEQEGEIVLAIRSTEPSVIAHEAVHVANQIFLDNHVKLSRTNDEPHAYLVGWVVKEVGKFINGSVKIASKLDHFALYRDITRDKKSTPIKLHFKDGDIEDLMFYLTSNGLYEKLERLDKTGMISWLGYEFDVASKKGTQNVTAIEMMDALVREADKERVRPSHPIILYLTKEQLDGLRFHFEKHGMYEELNRLNDYNVVKRLGYEFLIYFAWKY